MSLRGPQRLVLWQFTLFSIASSQPLLFEPQWCLDVASQPSCLASGDLNDDGMSEGVVGLYSKNLIAVNSRGQLLWERRVPHVPSHVQIADLNRDGNREIIVATFPHLLILDADGETHNDVEFPEHGSEFSSLGLAEDHDGSITIFLLAENRLYIVSGSGRLTERINLDFVPYKMRVGDIDGKAEIFLLSESRLACYSEYGKPIWHYQHSVSERLRKDVTTRAFEDAIDHATVRNAPLGSRAPIKNYRRDLEPIDVGDVNKDERMELIVSFTGRTEAGQLTNSVVCLDAATGRTLWTRTTPDPVLSVRVVDTLVCASGGHDIGEDRGGYLMRLNEIGIVCSERRYSWPAYFIRRVGDLVVACEREWALRCHTDSADDGAIFRGVYVHSTPYLCETCDLNGDGYTDVMLVMPSFENVGQFRIDAHLNNVPVLMKKAADAWTRYETLMLQGEEKLASRASEKAERFYAMVGKKNEGLACKEKIEQEVRQYQRAVLLTRLSWTSAVLLPLILLGYVYRKQIYRYLAQMKNTIVTTKSTASVDLLKNINSFVHESSKKTGALQAALNAIEQGAPVAKVMDYFNNRRQALKDEFKGHARQLSEYEAFNDRSAKELWKMLSVIPIMTTVANDEQKSETVRIAVITLHHRIDVDMRREVEAYQHSLDEALRASVDSILYEKAEHVPKYNLQIQLQVEEKSYPKEIYYTDFDQWKLLFTNLLRNAVEATVSAAEETSAIVQERRVVVATLEEEYGRELRQIIEIEDHGCGMDERTRANMFRSGFTYGKREGTGHGLTPELERFILAHGRYIVRTAKNVGTTIRIEVERV